MIGKQQADIGLKNTANISQLLFIPFMFWFNRNPGLSIPIIAYMNEQKNRTPILCGH